MTRAVHPVWAFFQRINLICAIVGAILLFGIAAIVCFEVLGRALGASSRLWVIEASEYALLFITFLGAPYLLQLKHHVVMDLLVNGLTGVQKRISQFVNALIGLLVCLVLTYVGVQIVLDQLDLGTREVTVMRPLSWWITSAMPLGTGLMAIQFLHALILSYTGEDV
ncbi:TRAP transporter small permease [Marivita sp. S6314]|uniref:TRAP transporter small permease n=1 Tax=Marivita sp. S6314 TaxID=2926406 RepID=UPI001FF17C5B|nr:TRAP transporter small permease [Marivita sp. S6314]MCK0150129.1 TRAP transporter small permease [Marivita sp. S6314]